MHFLGHEAEQRRVAVDTSEALMANALRAGATEAVAGAVPRAEGSTRGAPIARVARKALALAVAKTHAMAGALGRRPWARDVDGAVGASPAVVARTGTRFRALAIAAAILWACQWLHAVMPGEASLAAAELAISTSAMSAA